MVRRMMILFTAVSLGAVLPASATTTTLLDDNFSGPTVDTSVWHVNQPTNTTVGTTAGTDLEVTNANSNAGFWSTNSGIWTGHLFNRPAVSGGEVDVTFLGVQLPNAQQRFAFGLNSYDASNGQSNFALPDGDGQEDHLSYSFWIRPDDSFDQNWARTKTVNNAAAATTGNSEQLWYFGSVMDFQLRITNGNVQWYTRVEPSTTWTLVRDPFGSNYSTPFNGSEYGGRSTFGIFVEASSAGTDSGATWQNADVKMDRILVQTNFQVFPGDLNVDGVVNSSDLAILQQYNGQSVSGGASMGDINGDGIVDSDDWSLWLYDVAQYNFSQSVSAPEPMGSLMGLTLLGPFLWRRRRS